MTSLFLLFYVFYFIYVFIIFLCIHRYSLNGSDKEWLASTYSNKFYISDLPLDGDGGTVLFTVQVQYKSGVIQDINHARTYMFNY